MLSSPFELIVLLLLIAPGILYTISYRDNRKTYYKEPTTLEQITTSVTSSVLIHLYLLFFALVGYSISGFRPIVFLRLRIAIRNLPIYWTYYVLGCSYILLSFHLAHRSGRYFGNLAEGAIYVRAFFESSEDLDRGQADLPTVLIYMKDGTEWTGRLIALSPMGDKVNSFELLLHIAVRVSKEGERSGIKELVLIRSDQIDAITRIIPPPALVQRNTSEHQDPEPDSPSLPPGHVSDP